MSDEATKKATAATSETMDEIFHKAVRSYEKALKSGIQLQEESVPDAQRRVQDLIESSLTTLRVNVHSALNTNAKIIASWKELWTFQPDVK
jgi:hypothetical protein